MTMLEETGLHPSNTNNKRRVSTSFAKQSKLKIIGHLIEQSTYWVGLVEQNLYTLSLVSFYSNISKCTANDDQSHTLTNDDYNIQLRYYVLRGKLAQCNNDIEEAYAWFSNCKSLFKTIKSGNVTIDVHRYSILYSECQHLNHFNLLFIACMTLLSILKVLTGSLNCFKLENCLPLPNKK